MVYLETIYLSTLPTNEKKIRVGRDWFMDLFFPRDITRLSNVLMKKLQFRIIQAYHKVQLVL